ncbi:MAG: blaI 1 [Chthonomonadaceae bacterium]|nr:blaI 1 [Chthonomonadaceae bacterium]
MKNGDAPTSPRTGELGELQLAVLNVLWTCGQATVREVLDRLPGDRRPAYTTVLTVLRNLERRGLVAHVQPDGLRMFVYRPLISSHDTRGDILQDVLNRLFAGSPALLIKHLLQTEGFTLVELHDIQRVITTQTHAINPSAASDA